MFRQQYKIVVLKYCCRFIQNSSKHFCIYCYLPLACFCITPFGTCSSPCIKFYRLCSGLYFCFFLQVIHITFPSFQYSTLQCSFCTVIRLLVPFHVHIFCLDFFVSSYFEFLVQSFRKLYYMGCQLSVIVKCIKHMLACKFYFIFYFYLPLKSCNFDYSNLLLLVDISVGIGHCNHQPCSHINVSVAISMVSMDVRFQSGLLGKRGDQCVG